MVAEQSRNVNDHKNGNDQVQLLGGRSGVCGRKSRVINILILYRGEVPYRVKLMEQEPLFKVTEKMWI